MLIRIIQNYPDAHAAAMAHRLPAQDKKTKLKPTPTITDRWRCGARLSIERVLWPLRFL